MGDVDKPQLEQPALQVDRDTDLTLAVFRTLFNGIYAAFVRIDASNSSFVEHEHASGDQASRLLLSNIVLQSTCLSMCRYGHHGDVGCCRHHCARLPVQTAVKWSYIWHQGGRRHSLARRWGWCDVKVRRCTSHSAAPPCGHAKLTRQPQLGKAATQN